MLNQNFALATASIARANRPDIVPQKNVDYLAAMRQAGSDWQEAQNTAKLQALANALKAKDQALIDNAYADVDPQGRASWLYDRTAKVEDRDAGFQHDFDMADKNLETNIALSDHNLRNSKDLQKFTKELDQRMLFDNYNKIDEYINNSSLSDIDKERARLSYRNITLPKEKSVKEQLAESFLNPSTPEGKRNELRTQLQQIAQFEKEMSNISKPDLTFKDVSETGKNFGLTVDPQSLQDAFSTGDVSQIKFMQKQNELKGDAFILQKMLDEGTPLPEALDRIGKMTPYDKAYYAGVTAQAEAEGKLPSQITLEEQKLENQKELNLQEMTLAVQKLNMEQELKKDFEKFKSELPTEAIRNAQQISALTGENVDDILLAGYRESKLNAQKILAEIEEKQAEIAYKKAQAENAGKTNEIKNYEFAMKNGIDYSTLKPSGTSVTVNTGDMTGGVDTATLGKENAKNLARDLEEYGNMVSKMPELEATVKRLKELAPVATYTTTGKIRDILRQEIGRPTEASVARDEYESIIANQILPLLRDTFGAQFTEREGNSLKATLGDPNKSAESKVKVLDAFINQKRKSIESKARKIEMSQGEKPEQGVIIDFTEL